ncbi:MAG: hypothetical protein NT166_07875 [Candidatus Aminicenantes bacterium]|nr:hypothetical protein [Candidatus Aminicenantes bacterium]
MIDDYFENLEKTILDFKHIINSYTIFKKAEIRLSPKFTSSAVISKMELTESSCNSPLSKVFFRCFVE